MLKTRPNPELIEAACIAIGRAHDEGDGTADFEDMAAAVVTDLEPLIRQEVLDELLGDEVVEALASFEFDRLERGDLRIKGGPIPWEKCELVLREEMLDWARTALQAVIHKIKGEGR